MSDLYNYLMQDDYEPYPGMPGFTRPKRKKEEERPSFYPKRFDEDKYDLGVSPPSIMSQFSDAMNLRHDTVDGMTKINEQSLLNYLKFKAGTEAFLTAANVADRWLPNKDRRRESQLRHLTIIEKKRNLGLPVSDEEYEAAVNREKPFINPGTGITMATSIIRNPTSPLLNLGSVAGLFSRGRHVSRISKYLGL